MRHIDIFFFFYLSRKINKYRYAQMLILLILPRAKADSKRRFFVQG